MGEKRSGEMLSFRRIVDSMHLSSYHTSIIMMISSSHTEMQQPQPEEKRELFDPIDYPAVDCIKSTSSVYHGTNAVRHVMWSV